MTRIAAQIANARAALFVAALGVTFLALLVWAELTGWQSAVTRIEQETQNLAISLAQHADDSLELTQSPLADLVHELEAHDAAQASSQDLHELMSSILQASTRIKDLFIFGEAGQWLATSAEQVPANANNSDREYFQFHKQSTSRAVHLGKPILSRSNGNWVLTLSRRFNHPDGSFAGVVAATFEARYFSDYYEAAPIGTGGAILLVRGDGLVMARSPYKEDMIGADISSDQLFSHYLKTADSGSYRYISPIDNLARIGGFYRSWRSQLVVLVAVSEGEALANWANEARPRWAAGILVIIVSILLALRLAHQNKKRRQSEELLARMEAEFRLLAENSSDMVERIDVDCIRRYVSPAAKRLVGIDPADLLGNKAFDRVHGDDRAYVLDAAQRLRDGAECNTVTFRTKHASGREIWLETNLSALPRSEEGHWTGAVAVTRDVTARKHLEVKLAAMATVDGLTGLSNRHAFDARLTSELRRARREKSTLSILMIDADHFKLFNDTYGHIAGDNCLRSISETISGWAQRPGDMAARFGGEEIVVLLPNTDNAGAQALAERICASIEGLGIPHEKNVPWGKVTVSVGGATFIGTEGPDYSETSLLQAADSALYGAKMADRNRVVMADKESPYLTLVAS